MKKIENIKSDKVVDAFYTGVASQLVDDIITETDNLEMPEFDFTEMDNWFDEFHDKSVKKQQFKSFQLKSTKVMRFAAITLITIGLTFSTLMMSVEAFRVSVFNLFVTEEQTHTLFEQVEDDMLEQLLIPYPRMLPQGYQVYSYEQVAGISIIEFRDKSEGYITYTITDAGGSVMLNTEEAKVETIEIQNNEYTLATSEAKLQAFWHDEEYNYSIVTNLDLKNLKKIINSIK